MAGTVAELRAVIQPQSFARSLVEKFDTWNYQRVGWIAEQNELRNYLFATDTSTTSNSTLPWKNRTTLPKLTQIRDNLHANYLSALFPNEEWMKWEAYDVDSADKDKRIAIQAYMENKVRESGFRETISDLICDFIDYGNCFSDVVWVNDTVTDEVTGEETVRYVGPKLVRRSPYDIVFNPAAPTFDESPKVIRKLLTIGELKQVMDENPEDASWAVETVNLIGQFRNICQGYKPWQFDKALGFQMDGFGSLYEYYQSGLVEILEFRGDFHDMETGTFYKNAVITVADRTHIVRNQKNPSWFGNGYLNHCAWRSRTDNLYGMGPLHNLVGMQYRIDHLENLKADVFDLIAFPPLKIIGEVEEFDWAPMSRIVIDEGGDVQMLVPDTTALNADLQIARLEQKMEEFAGSPRETMGFRTPGEKTAFEVQTLITAAGRIFQEKITAFEFAIVERSLNQMLEMARRNMDVADVVRILDPDIGVEKFLSITKQDIIAKGKLRAVGARHFAAQAQLVQNLVQISQTPLWQQVSPHLSAKNLAATIEDVLNLERRQLFKDNVGIIEQGETARIAQQVQQDVQVESNIDEGVPNGNQVQ